MKAITKMNRQEKITFIKFLQESEEVYFTDYSKELTILAKDPESKIRMKAIELLWDEPNSQNMQNLLRIAEKDTAPEVRHRAIIGLGRYIYEGMEFSYNDSFEIDDFENEMYEESITKEEYMEVRDYLLNLYSNSEKSIDERRYALEALSFAVEEDIQNIIRHAYNATEKAIRRSALFAMGRNGLLCWKNILITELNNQDEMLQKEAINAVGEMGLIEAGSELLKLTYATNPEIAKIAIRALAQTGWQEAFERLDELSRINNKEIRELAEAALEEWLACNTEDEEEDLY